MGLAPATGAPFQSTLSTAPADWTVALVAPTGLLISSNTLTFPAIYPNFPSTPQTLRLTNAGAQPITLSLFGFYGVDKGDFSIASNQCTVSPYLFSGESCTIQITFTPSAVGARSASLSIGSSAPNFPVQVPLTRTGAAKFWDPAGLFAIIAGFYKGGGFTKCDRDQQRSFCYRDWSNHEQYCDLDEQLRNRDSVGIQLHSIGRGEINWIDGTDRNLSVITSSTAGVQAIPIQVEVSPLPGLGFTAVSPTFGTWAVGVTSSPYVSVNNLTGASVTHYPSAVLVGPNAADFSFVNVGPFVGGDNGYGCYSTFCEANLTFTPSGTGLRTATMQTAMGDVQLSGTGMADGPSFVLRIGSLIPPTAVGSSAAPIFAYLTNNGSTSISQTASITGANASDFSITHPNNSGLCGSSVASGTLCSLSVVFTPSQLGTRTATLTVTDSISGTSQAILLSAIGEP